MKKPKGQRYTYVPILTPEGKRLSPTASDISGLSWEDIDEARWNKQFSIKPSMVETYIRNHVK